MWVINNCVLTLSALIGWHCSYPTSYSKHRCLNWKYGDAWGLWVLSQSGLGDHVQHAAQMKCVIRKEMTFLFPESSSIHSNAFYLSFISSPFTSRNVLKKCKPKSAATLLTFPYKISWRNRGRLICWELSTVCSTVSVPYFHPVPAKGSHRWAYA